MKILIKLFRMKQRFLTTFEKKTMEKVMKKDYNDASPEMESRRKKLLRKLLSRSLRRNPSIILLEERKISTIV